MFNDSNFTSILCRDQWAKELRLYIVTGYLLNLLKVSGNNENLQRVIKSMVHGPGSSMLHLQGLSNIPHPELNQFNYLHRQLFL